VKTTNGTDYTEQSIPSSSLSQVFSVLGVLREPLILLDPKMNIQYMNAAAEKCFGQQLSEVHGIPMSSAVGSDDLLSVAQSTKMPQEWNKGEQTFVPQLEALHDSAGEISGWLLLLKDVTFYKKLSRNQTESMRIVLHDLRSPLTAMLGFSSMMEMVGELNEKQTHFVSKIISGINQMTALVENIQDAGRYDPISGFYEPVRSPCDIGEIARKIVENHLIPADKRLQIGLVVADNLPIVNVDATMLERAINNLFDNAIKYTPTGGSINVSVKVIDNQIVIAVKDSGLGISPQSQANLFERHVRIARPEFKKIKGTGLGLFVVRSVARRHGGDAWVESTGVDGEGATFLICIPVEGANLIAPTK